jgi:hypothetical protein
VKVKHAFFEKSRKAQKGFQRNLALVSLLLSAVAGVLLHLVGLLPLIFFFVSILLSIVAPFFDVPNMIRSGKMHYCSPFLLCEAERNHKIVLHAGTLFDFFFVFPKEMSAGERQRMAQSGIVEGLINLIELHEMLDRPELRVQTTSYILNERSASKLGLEKQPTDASKKLLLYFNYFNLTASYSLLHRRLRFPAVKSVQTFEGSMAMLIERKPYLETLKNRLERPTK